MPLLAIDQGTTSTRVMVFDDTAQPLSIARRELQQHYPERGWVEHDVEDIWRDLPVLMREAVEQAGVPVSDIAGIGITNQRETTVLWDRRTGEPVHRAIVWQDRRTAAACRQLIDDGVEPMIRQKTGLLLDPYFSATKLAWLLDHVPQARDRAERGELCFGTIDSFLLFRLTRGRLHATDATNAARTMLFNIHTQDWDDELLRLFGIPRAILPEVRDSSGDFGTTSLLGPAIPIAGVAGDQQAATFGQACFTPGMIKSTYGTGCFALMNTGTQVVESRNRLLSTVAYRLNGQPVYAVEGAIFVAGAAVKWLRDRLRVITHASQTDDLATRVADNHGVYFVPAFVGLGAPYWDAEARAAIHGLTFDAGPEHIARAALEAVGFQTRDLIEAMIADGAQRPKALRVDGGMVANDWLCQFLSGMADLPVDRPAVIETTAFGAACLAGLHVGVFPDLAAITAARRSARTFTPDMDAERRTRLYAGWQTAVAAVRTQHRGQNAAPSPA